MKNKHNTNIQETPKPLNPFLRNFVFLSLSVFLVAVGFIALILVMDGYQAFDLFG